MREEETIALNPIQETNNLPIIGQPRTEIAVTTTTTIAIRNIALYQAQSTLFS